MIEKYRYPHILIPEFKKCPVCGSDCLSEIEVDEAYIKYHCDDCNCEFDNEEGYIDEYIDNEEYVDQNYLDRGIYDYSHGCERESCPYRYTDICTFCEGD